MCDMKSGNEPNDNKPVFPCWKRHLDHNKDYYIEIRIRRWASN